MWNNFFFFFFFFFLQVVCDLCSSNRAPLEYKNHHPERVCDHCYEALYSALQERITSRDSEEGVGRPEEGFKEECGEKKLLRKELSLNELRKLKVQFKKGIRDSMRGKTLKKPERLREVRPCPRDCENASIGWYFRRDGWLDRLVVTNAYFLPKSVYIYIFFMRLIVNV